MQINIARVSGKAIVVGLITVGFVIGNIAARDKCEVVPQDHVVSMGHAAKRVGKESIITLYSVFHPTMAKKKKKIQQMNAQAFADDKDDRWELVEIFYRKVDE